MAGKVVHFEIPVDDGQRAGEFYRTAFGWSLERWGPLEYWTTPAGEGRGHRRGVDQTHRGVTGADLLHRGGRHRRGPRRDPGCRRNGPGPAPCRSPPWAGRPCSSTPRATGSACSSRTRRCPCRIFPPGIRRPLGERRRPTCLRLHAGRRPARSAPSGSAATRTNRRSWPAPARSRWSRCAAPRPDSSIPGSSSPGSRCWAR